MDLECCWKRFTGKRGGKELEKEEEDGAKLINTSSYAYHTFSSNQNKIKSRVTT